MRANRRKFTLAMALALVPLLAACEPDTEVEDDLDVPPASEVAPGEELRVTDVEVGRSIGSDGRVNDNDETDEFGSNDTIYISVDTEGTASGATLAARWKFEDGQVVDETSQTISPSTASVTEFHISKPDGFPAGEYEVEILLDGRVVETEDFTVR